MRRWLRDPKSMALPTLVRRTHSGTESIYIDTQCRHITPGAWPVDHGTGLSTQVLIEATVKLCPGRCARVGHRPELPELAEVTFGSVAAFIQLDYRPGWPTCRAPETGAAMLLRSVRSINAKYIFPAQQSIS